jgi:hypothetical protein
MMMTKGKALKKKLDEEKPIAAVSLKPLATILY